MKWGTVGLKELEQDRPLYVGEQINSPINGKPITYFSPTSRFIRTKVSLTAVVVMVDCVLSIVTGIFFFQYFLTNEVNLIYYGRDFSHIIASVLQSVIIVVMNIIYLHIAIALNNFENHRTDTQYEDFLISKIFVFQVVNSFAGLSYVAFIKSFIGVTCTNLNCSMDVADTLSTIFLSSLISRAIIQVFIRRLLQEYKDNKESNGLPSDSAGPTPLEKQYILDSYPPTIGTLIDYAGLVMQFGYTILFVAAFPLAPTMSLISGYVQIRIDGWKLCQAFRRPQPRSAESIGVWEDMIFILTVIAIIYNFALIFFTGHYLINSTWEIRWFLFVILEHVTVVIKFTISFLLSGVPKVVQIQLARQDFLVSKVIRNCEDEKDDTFIQTSVNKNFIIHQNDDDYEDVTT